MFSDQAYSLRTLVLMTGVIITAALSAGILALVAEKFNKRPFFWLAAVSLFFLNVFTAVRFILLIAPTAYIYQAVNKVEFFAGVVAGAVPLAMTLFLAILRVAVGRILMNA